MPPVLAPVAVNHQTGTLDYPTGTHGRVIAVNHQTGALEYASGGLPRPISINPVTGVLGYPTLTPDQVSNLFAWYKIDTLSALANNDPVTSWADSSGNSHTIAQGTGASQPLYKTGIWNSRAGVLFDGDNDGLFLNPFASGVLAQPTTIIMVSKLVVAAGQFYDGPGADRQTLYISGGNWIIWNGADGPSGAANTNAHVMTMVNNGAASVLRVDGAQSGAAADASTNGLGGLYLGTTQGLASGINGYIGEFVIYSGIVAASQLQSVERGLGIKYGITVA